MRGLPVRRANAALAVWVLKIVPQQGVTLDLDLARQYMKEKNYLRVLYILEGLPETDETRLMKLEARCMNRLIRPEFLLVS